MHTSGMPRDEEEFLVLRRTSLVPDLLREQQFCVVILRVKWWAIGIGSFERPLEKIQAREKEQSETAGEIQTPTFEPMRSEFDEAMRKREVVRRGHFKEPLLSGQCEESVILYSREAVSFNMCSGGCATHYLLPKNAS